MHTASINTTSIHCGNVLLTSNPIVKRVCNMLRVSLILCFVPVVFNIIVKDPPPSPNDYKYSYNVEDPTTGDTKSQHEVRQGDVVTGAYTVVGPDGTKRTVEYTADGKHGFKATVREDPVNPIIVTQPPIVNHQYNGLQYQTARPAYGHVLQARPKLNFARQPMIYFTPQHQIEPRLPFDGQYFIPAHVK